MQTRVQNGINLLTNKYKHAIFQKKIKGEETSALVPHKRVVQTKYDSKTTTKTSS